MKKAEKLILEMLKNDKKRDNFFTEINKTVSEIKSVGQIDGMISIVDLIQKLNDLNIIKIN